jgi:hypothetical protein
MFEDVDLRIADASNPAWGPLETYGTCRCATKMTCITCRDCTHTLGCTINCSITCHQTCVTC